MLCHLEPIRHPQAPCGANPRLLKMAAFEVMIRGGV
jgi:hypothetical protein